MKRFFLILFCLLVLSACQPTPEVEFVVNKGDDTLETVIHSKPQMSAEAAQTVQDALGVPETVQRTVSGPVYGGTLHVESDTDGKLFLTGTVRLRVRRTASVLI